jgi:hypothetical protein
VKKGRSLARLLCLRFIDNSSPLTTIENRTSNLLGLLKAKEG